MPNSFQAGKFFEQFPEWLAMLREDMPVYARKWFEDGYSGYLTARVPQTIRPNCSSCFHLHRRFVTDSVSDLLSSGAVEDVTAVRAGRAQVVCILPLLVAASSGRKLRLCYYGRCVNNFIE